MAAQRPPKPAPTINTLMPDFVVVVPLSCSGGVLVWPLVKPFVSVASPAIGTKQAIQIEMKGNDANRVTSSSTYNVGVSSTLVSRLTVFT